MLHNHTETSFYILHVPVLLVTMLKLQSCVQFESVWGEMRDFSIDFFLFLFSSPLEFVELDELYTVSM